MPQIPDININYVNGQLGGPVDGTENVVAVIANNTGIAVGAPILSQTVSVAIFTPQEAATALGSTDGTIPTTSQLGVFLAAFFADGISKEIWVKLYSSATLYSALATQGIPAVAADSAGRVSTVFLVQAPAPGYTPTIANKMDGEVATAITNAATQVAAAITNLKAPMMVVVGTYGLDVSVNTTGLLNPSTLAKPRVVVVADETPTNEMGILAQLLGKIPVQRSISRVKDGAVAIAARPLAQWQIFYDNAFVFGRNFPGIAGVFFIDDRTASATTDDYANITRVRTADKAYRIAYRTLVNELHDEVPRGSDGTIRAEYVKSLERLVENAVAVAMDGEISTSDTDRGVIVQLAPSQNPATNGGVIRIERLSVRPFGYARMIEANLGFM